MFKQVEQDGKTLRRTQEVKFEDGNLYFFPMMANKAKIIRKILI